jgi:hypothetical protein
VTGSLNRESKQEQREKRSNITKHAFLRRGSESQMKERANKEMREQRKANNTGQRQQTKSRETKQEHIQREGRAR